MTIYGSIVNLCVNLLLIPKMGAVGAIIGTLIGESLISFLYVYFAQEYASFRLIFEKSYKRILAGIVMIVAGFMFSKYIGVHSFVMLFAQIFSCAIVYALVLLGIKDKMAYKFMNIALSKIKIRK